jgi:hypothetical protein
MLCQRSAAARAALPQPHNNMLSLHDCNVCLAQHATQVVTYLTPSTFRCCGTWSQSSGVMCILGQQQK